MTSLSMALLIKPLVTFLFFALIVLPIEWLLFQVFPDGRLKVALFRPMTGERARPGDRRKWIAAAILANVVLWCWIGFVISLGP